MPTGRASTVEIDHTRHPASAATDRIIAELADISLKLAIATSIANALAAGRPCIHGAGDILAIAPSTDALADAIKCSSEIAGADIAVSRSIQRLSMLISFARNVTDVMVTTGSEQMMTASSAAWTRAASACVIAGILFERGQPEGFAVDTVLPTAGIRRILRAACGGASPCIDGDGRLHIPGWADRRSDMRSDTRALVFIECNGVRGSATVINVSPGGLKLVSSFPLPRDADITVSTSEGHEVRGRIAWSNGEEAGITVEDRFDPALLLKV